MNLDGNYINGTWVAPTGVVTHRNYNPATGELIEESALSTVHDVNTAVQSAQRAFFHWGKVPDGQRGDVLFRLADEICADRMQLAQAMTTEMGKVLSESLGEVDVVIAHALFMAGEGKRALGEVLPSSRTNRIITTRRHPRGVVACITPWNFPIVLAAYKIFAALISGNTVVWKPAPNVSKSARLFVAALERAGLPDGACNLICSGGVDVGEALVAHPDIAVVAFTGSTPVGRSIAQTCAGRFAPTLLELGGKNAIIVMEDADLDDAASGIMQSGFATSGQRCTAASRIIVHSSIEQQLLSILGDRISGLAIGNGLEQGTTFGPLALESQLERIDGMVSRAISAGAELVTGGIRLSGAGYFYAPTLLTGISGHDEIAQNEVFGPVLSVIKVADLDEAIAVNNSTEFGLSSAIYTQSLTNAFRASDECQSGLVYVNSGTSAAEIGVPFGGVKNSGNGHAEVSRHALDVMTYIKATYMSFEGQQRDL
jgi:aldehyde dehydrogenase (NAD+)